MARSKKEQERYLEKRREMKKMSMRKAREKLRSDPVKYEEIKAKDRNRYRRKKEEGKVKLIGEMSNRDQRRIRQEWRKRSEKYRLKKKNEENIHDFVVSNSPPSTPESQIEIIQPSTSRQQECGKKIARKNREIKNQKIKQLQKKLDMANSKVNR
ncbi:glutamic acid-rich protein [Nilaparvata lugens]|uniref:glutamic acid-rich protein n=1 Tax=Nilaparvata lugens TaxID=108931 RepID=UPI00193E9B60|nr:glutamic acid-rich protein [Nilaparvata lugens]